MLAALTNTFSKVDIAAAQSLADRWYMLAMFLWLLGIIFAIWSGSKNFPVIASWLVTAPCIMAGAVILDFVIMMSVHSRWPGMLNFLSGNYGEQPVTMACFVITFPVALAGTYLGKWLSRLILLSRSVKVA